MTLEVPDGIVWAIKAVHTAVTAAAGLLGLKLYFSALFQGLFRQRKEDMPEKAQNILVLTCTLSLFTAWLAILVIYWTWA